MLKCVKNQFYTRMTPQIVSNNEFCKNQQNKIKIFLQNSNNLSQI